MYMYIFLCVFLHSAIAGYENRIAGGNNVFIKDHPYQAALYINNKRFQGYYQGAVIVSPKHLLTLANPGITMTKTLSVVIGESFIPMHYDIDWLTKRAYQAENILVHPDYETFEYGNDIAIVTVDREMDLDGKSAMAIQLSQQPTPPGTMAVACGFGVSAFFDQLPKPGTESFAHLQAVRIPTVAHDFCVKFYAKSSKWNLEHMICAGLERDKGTCIYDQGGALVSNNELIGLASIPNCWFGPGGYSDVYKQRDFIIQAINETLESDY